MSQLSLQPFFEVTDPANAQYVGGFPAKNDAELCSGKLAVLNTDGTMEQAGATDKPNGFCFTNRYLLYAPTSFYAAEGEYVTLVTGEVLALADSGLFKDGTLPDVGDALYAAANGLMDTSGTNQVGKVIAKQDIRAVPNTSRDVVLIQCHFGGKDI